MYPELIKIGNFPVHTYGILLAIAILIALMTASRLAKYDGLPSQKIYDIGLWTVIGGLLGSKILLLVVDESFRNDPSNIFSLDFLRSGGVYYGGFIGGFVTLLLLIKLYNLPFWKVADAFAPGVAIGQAIGRLGCFAAGCCWGKPTTLPWGVHFSDKGHEYTGVPISDSNGNALFLHPTQIYESIAMLIVFLFLIFLHRHKKFDGQVLAFYGLIYPLVRFTIEFFRDDPRGDLFGLTSLTGLSTSQLISLLVALSAIGFLLLRMRSK